MLLGYFYNKKNKISMNISHINIKIKDIIFILLILFYMFYEVYYRKLIAGDALAVYYLKAKAMYYSVPIENMPTASYSIYPSSLWLILSSFTDIEIGAELSRYFFPIIAMLGIFGIYFQIYKNNKSHILLYSLLLGFFLIRIGGFYPITMGYFDWLLGIILMYITYILIYDDDYFVNKIFILLNLSCIGLVKLEGLIYLNIILFVFMLIKIEFFISKFIKIIIFFCILNLISLSYVIFIKIILNIFDYQVFKVSFDRDVWIVLSLMIKAFLPFIKESFLIITIYIISLIFSNKKLFVQFIIIFLILLSYFVIYYFTLVDIDWHIATSFQRLIYQIIPMIILFSFINFKDYKS
jgi:hypothetical protein